MMATAKNKLSTDFQSAINCVPERSLLGAFGKQHHDYDHDVFNSAGSTLATPHFGPENGVHLKLPDGEEVIDFYHAAGHLDTALAAAYGDTHPKRRAQFEKQRHVLLEDYKGVEKVIRSLVHLRDTYPRRKKIARELKYFRRNRHRMRYTALKEQGLPIGSEVTEAACKTLATQRMKRSGMRWGEQGGQAILSFRALVQSNRFERAWTLLAHTYKAEVTTLDNVVPIRSWQ